MHTRLVNCLIISSQWGTRFPRISNYKCWFPDASLQSELNNKLEMPFAHAWGATYGINMFRPSVCLSNHYAGPKRILDQQILLIIDQSVYIDRPSAFQARKILSSWVTRWYLYSGSSSLLSQFGKGRLFGPHRILYLIEHQRPSS